MPAIRSEKGRASAAAPALAAAAGLGARRGGRRPAQGRAFHGDEARAEAVGARQVGVAARLVDAPLAAELGLHRHDRQAVRRGDAVAAVLAHSLVDEGVARRRRHLAAAAPAALLGGAGLVEDQHGDARHLAQLALGAVERVASAHRHAGREGIARRITVRLLRGDDDARDALGLEDAGDARHGQGALDRLPAGHRHRVVEQQAVGDVDAGRDRGADGEQAGMGEGAVADVLEHVRRVGERRLADPGRAFAAHLGQRLGARGRSTAPWCGSRCRRARGCPRAGAWRGCAGSRSRNAAGAAAAAWRGSAPRPAFFHRPARRVLAPFRQIEPARHHAGDAVRRQFARGGQQRPVVAVALAAHPRALGVGQIVEQVAQLAFDQRTLLLDHQHLVEARGEAAHALGLERPDHGDPVESQAERAAARRVEPEIGERLGEIAPRLAGGGDAARRAGRVGRHAVERVGARESLGGLHLGACQARFLEVRAVGPADMQPVGGRREIRRHVRRRAGVRPHGGGAFGDVGGKLQRGPAAGVARHGQAGAAEIEDVLHVGGDQHRHHGVGQGELALVRCGRGGRRVIVAGHHQHPAVGRGARQIGMLEGVARAVDAGSLAVPQAEHPVLARAVEQADLLGAPQRGRRQFLVQPGLEGDLVGGEGVRGAAERLVQPAERRAAIARDIARGAQARRRVALGLRDQHADQRLAAGQEDAAAARRWRVVVVAWRGIGQGHDNVHGRSALELAPSRREGNGRAMDLDEPFRHGGNRRVE